MIAIIDYGSGNVGAVANIYKQLKIAHRITGDLAELEAADRYVLPGVGAFDTTMDYFRRSGMTDLLHEQVVERGKKVLGICVGMQILADSSEEGMLPGLGWIPGRVRKIDASLLPTPPRLPHMGWNSVEPRKGARLFDGVDVERGFYFLHSYYFDAIRGEDVAATVSYGAEISCAVAYGNVFGMQFHPEKSHANGVAVFRNFAEL
jgi:glutamine amidotransferase